MPEVARLRGLDFTEPVPVRRVTQADVAAYVRRALAEEMSERELKGFEKILKHMGLLDREADLADILIRTYSQQIAGFYDDKDKSFSVVANSGMPAGLDAVTIAHELTHALQDQRYGLAKFRTSSEGNDDMTLALTALIEGDASDIMMRYGTGSYARGCGPAKDFTSFIAFSAGSSSIPGLPMFLAQNMLFPYTYGSRFVVELMKRGGDQAVDAAFADPPISTEQVMNPDKYFQRDEPVIIDLPDLTEVLPDGWELLDQTTLGQFNLGLFLANSIGTFGVDEAIAGWEGDTLAGYGGHRYDEFVLVYSSTWDDVVAAGRFASLYRKVIKSRFPGLTEGIDDGVVATWIRDDVLYYIRQDGADVLVIENAPLACAGEIVVRCRQAQKTGAGLENPVADTDRLKDVAVPVR